MQNMKTKMRYENVEFCVGTLFIVSFQVWGAENDGIQTWLMTHTLPETDIDPENRPLEKEIPIGNHHFLGASC